MSEYERRLIETIRTAPDPGALIVEAIRLIGEQLSEQQASEGGVIHG